MSEYRVPFDKINRAALARAEDIVCQWLPGGRFEGPEYTVRNPRRADRKPGSFRINVRSGRWSDFATGDSGGDLISLAAYLFGLSQPEAAREVARMVGVPVDD